MADDLKPGEVRWRSVLRRANEDMLYAEDIGGFGIKPLDVEIIDSGVKEVKGPKGKTVMPWLQFRGKKGPSKKLGCGATMCKVMQTITGTDVVQRWRGWITLVVIKTTYTDDKTQLKLETDAIRIATKRPNREASSKAAPETAKPAPDLDVAPVDPAPPAAELTDEDKRAIEMAEAADA